MLNNYSCRSPLETSSVFWKSGENFNLEELTNLILVGYNFTENFSVDETSKTIPTPVSLGEFIDQLLSKVISLQEKKQAVWFFKEAKSKFLLDTLQSKKKKKKNE